MKTSPVLMALVALVATACGASVRVAATSTSITTTTVPAVDRQILAAFRAALDADYAIGAQPAVQGDVQAATGLGLSPQLSATFIDPAYTQVRVGITDSHLNGVQGPATYTLAQARVTSATPPSSPTAATVDACLFDTGDFHTATHAAVTDVPGAQAGWAYGTWDLTLTNGAWKVSNFHYNATATTDGEHPICSVPPTSPSADSSSTQP